MINMRAGARADLHATRLAFEVPKCRAEPRVTMDLCVSLCQRAGLASVPP